MKEFMSQPGEKAFRAVISKQRVEYHNAGKVTVGLETVKEVHPICKGCHEASREHWMFPTIKPGVKEVK